MNEDELVWFDRKFQSLNEAPTETETPNMTINYSTAVFLVNPDVRAIKTQYDPNMLDDSANGYRSTARDGKNVNNLLFKTLDKTVAVGQYVVVPTGTRHKMTVVKVVEVDVPFNLEDTALNMPWIVGKVDKTEFDKHVADEASMIETMRSAQHRKLRADMSAAIFKDQMELAKLGAANPLFIEPPKA